MHPAFALIFFLLYTCSETSGMHRGTSRQSEEEFLTPAKYHKYNELKTLFKNLERAYPRQAKLFTIGQSVKNRDLMVMQINGHVRDVPRLTPKFKYVANINGDETAGRQLIIYLAQYLLESYGKNRRIKNLVDNTNIFLLPTMNPDGFESTQVGICRPAKGVKNKNGIILSQDFPNGKKRDLTKNQTQPETQALMDWMDHAHFVLSGALRGGSLGTSYPNLGQSKSRRVDQILFKHLTEVYFPKRIECEYPSSTKSAPDEQDYAAMLDSATYVDGSPADKVRNHFQYAYYVHYHDYGGHGHTNPGAAIVVNEHHHVEHQHVGYQHVEHQQGTHQGVQAGTQTVANGSRHQNVHGGGHHGGHEGGHHVGYGGGHHGGHEGGHHVGHGGGHHGGHEGGHHVGHGGGHHGGHEGGHHVGHGGGHHGGHGAGHQGAHGGGYQAGYQTVHQGSYQGGHHYAHQGRRQDEVGQYHVHERKHGVWHVFPNPEGRPQKRVSSTNEDDHKEAEMHDFNYFEAKCVELTIMLSCCESPPVETLKTLWYRNKDSLINFIEATHLGVKGIVKGENDAPVAEAIVIVNGDYSHVVKTTINGEYWKLLPPGRYNVSVKSNLYHATETEEIIVTEDRTTIKDFTLTQYNKNIFKAKKGNNPLKEKFNNEEIGDYYEKVSRNLEMKFSPFLLCVSFIFCTLITYMF